MTKIALLIGVSQYQSDLTPLPKATKDVEAMQNVLQNPAIGRFERVEIRLDPDAQTMREEIEVIFSECQKDDLVLLFFSGHGIKNDRGKLYFATNNTRKNDQGKLIWSTTVAASWIQDLMTQSRCKHQVVILDCCFSGAFAAGMTAKGTGNVDIQTQLGGEGRAVLTSSTSTQYSFEQEESDLSIYSRYIVEGIATGAADLDSDGWIEVQELHEYAKGKVQATAPAMMPEIYAVKEGFKIRLAKALITDPKLKYRKEVERYANRADIPDYRRIILDTLRGQLGLSSAEAAAIEDEVLRPYRERLEHLQRYREALTAAVEYEYPLSEAIVDDLKHFQGMLGLRDEDIQPIEDDINIEPTQDDDKFAGLSLLTDEFETVTVNTKGEKGSLSTHQAQFFKEDLGNGVILEMVSIPAGEFMMGSPSEEKDRDEDESPQHKVSVPAFFMGKFAVTQAQYQAVTGSNPAHFKGDNRPVETVSWNEANEFCQKLSQNTGRNYRLPSEAEWEYACRAGTTTPFHFGATLTSNLANYNGNYTYQSEPEGEYRVKTTEAGSFPPNAFGLYDMHGNVWEWCRDHWHDNYNGAPDDGSAWLTENDNDNRSYLLRGGSWGSNPRGCRSANRQGNDADVR